MIDILLAVLYLAAGLVASWEARRKGYSDWLWLAVALVFGPITLFVFWVLPTRALPVGAVVRTVAPIALDDGGRIPAGHVSVVREAQHAGPAIVCRISAPDGRHHWVAQEALSRVRFGLPREA